MEDYRCLKRKRILKIRSIQLGIENSYEFIDDSLHHKIDDRSDKQLELLVEALESGQSLVDFVLLINKCQ